jgi:AcrR family transcriptional regulator
VSYIDHAARRRAPSPAVEARRAVQRTGLLDAAVRAIRRDGPDVSMDAMAAEAGVTKPILYRHFGDKDGLYVALAERHVATLFDLVSATLSRHGDPRDVLVASIDAFLAFIERDAAVYHFLMRRAAADQPELQTVLQDFKAQCAQSIAVLLFERFSARGVDPEAIEPWTHGLVGASTSVAEWWIETRTMPREEVARHLAALFQGGMFEGEGGR